MPNAWGQVVVDGLIAEIDKAMRTVFAPGRNIRPMPGSDLPEAELAESEKQHVAALMRVNHCGEICAQALYQGQALASQDQAINNALRQAAREEGEHLAWTERRLRELGGRQSLLNPLWYGGSFAIGVVAGLLGDKWNLGFLAETEHQVGAHLASHLQQLPNNDEKSRAIVTQMEIDEASHATMALSHGGAELPLPVKFTMKLGSKVMTRTAYWI